MWHLTRDKWLVGNIVSKFKLSSLTVWEVWCFEDLEEKGDLVNELMYQSGTEVFVEQPWLHPAC